MAAPDKPAKKRLFFAVYPDATTRQTLAEAAQPLISEGKPSPAGNLHITLAFIGMADTVYQDCLTEQALQIKTPTPFDTQIDRIGLFRKARILWLGPSQPPSELVELHDNLVTAIQSCGYKAETRPWFPHITVARKYRGNAQGRLKNPIALRADAFSLMESVSSVGGVRNVELRKFPLQNRDWQESLKTIS